jgi:peptidyl-prolyl cis-trans isomerase-like 4
MGTVSMAVSPDIVSSPSSSNKSTPGGCASQFFLTLSATAIPYLDGRHAVFGHVVEGLDTLEKMNDVFTDQDGRPLRDVRIRGVVVLGKCVLETTVNGSWVWDNAFFFVDNR